MVGWELRNIGDVLKLEYGKPLPKENRDEAGAHAAYGANGVLCRTNEYYWEKPSIIVGRKGSAGEINLVEDKFWPLDVTYFVTFDEQKYDLKFLYYCLQCLNLTSLAKGVKPGINRNDVYALKTAFPPLPEQKRIVAILDDAFAGIDAAVANTEKNLANARELFESYLNGVFTWKGEGWMEKKLSTLIDISHGFAFKGPDFKPSDDNSKPIVLTPGNYSEDAELYFTEKNTKRFTGKLPKDYLFEAGDLTVVMTDLSSKMKILGKPAFIDRANVLHNQRIGRVIFKDKGVAARFIYYFLRSRPVTEKIKETSTGTMVRHTAPSRILTQNIAYPQAMVEQINLVASLDDLSSETQRLESIYQQKLAALTELKQSILQKAFAGELTAQPEQALEEAVA